MIRRMVSRSAILCAVMMLSSAGGAAAQMIGLVGSRSASRAELNRMLDSLQRVVPTVEDEDRRFEVQNQVDGLTYRLENGDVWPGDVVDLWVSGEDRWTDQYSVTPSRTIELEDIDPVPVDGVLYSELEDAIAAALGEYLRDPRIRVSALKRIGVLGEVGNPGFYLIEGSMLVSEVVMEAGGPLGNADLDDIEFRRLGERIAAGRPRVVWQSLSLDQLGVNSGDEVYVPARAQSFGRIIMAAVGTALSLTFILIRIF